MPNRVDLQHKELIKKILTEGVEKIDRTGVGTKSIFGHQMRFLMGEGFPMVSIRRIHMKSTIHEMLWFLGAYDQGKYSSFGNTNIRYLLDHDVTFWSDWPYKKYMESRKYRPELPEFNMNEFQAKIVLDDDFAREFGSIGPGYGKQWLSYGSRIEKKQKPGSYPIVFETIIHPGINQIETIIDQLKKDPDSRRIILDAWKVDELEEMLLPPCFLSGVKVFTSKGYKNIEDIKVGEKVFTHLGNFKEVNKIFKTPYKGKILNIRPRYVSHEFGCTPNHPFLVKDKGWVNAENIGINDKLCIKINKSSIIPELKIRSGVNQYKDFKIKDIKLDNMDDWYIMGYFLGDGWINHINPKKGQIFFAINEEQEEKIVAKISKRMSLYKDKKHIGKVHRFECRNKKWYEILKEFGRFSHGKIIPNWVQDAPIEYINVFLDGYQDSDGSIVKRNKSKVFLTTSNDISFGIQRLFAKIGRVSSHVFQNRKETTEIMGREVNQKSTYNISLNNRPHKSRFNFDEEYLYVGISKIEEVQVENYVYNLSVDDDNSYTVNNICTHNCHMMFQMYSFRMNEEDRLHSYSSWINDNKLVFGRPMEEYNFPERKLSMQLYIRSQDVGLGQPFNIAEYALLLHMIAQIVHMIPHELIINIGDAHIYNNHIEAMQKIIKRDSYDQPKIWLNPEIKNICDFRFDDIKIIGYRAHSNIPMDVAV